MILIFKTIPNWRINIDRYNHAVEEFITIKKGNNTGKSHWAAKSWHPNTEQACRSLALELVGEEEGLKEIEEVKEFMVDIFNKIGTITLPTTEGK